MIGIGISIVSGRKHRPQFFFCATRLDFETSSSAPAAGKEICVSQVYWGSPDYILNDVRFFLPAFYVLTSGASPFEIALENGFSVVGPSIKIGNTWYASTINGSAAAAAIDPSSGTPGVWSDPINVPGGIPANSLVQTRVAWQVDAGQKMLTGLKFASTGFHPGEGQKQFASMDLAIASLTDNSATATTALLAGGFYGPMFAVGTGANCDTFFYIGDSVGRGANSDTVYANARGCYGFLELALDDIVESKRLPYGRYCVNGQSPLTFSTRTKWQKTADAIKELPNLPFNKIISQHGINSKNDAGGVGQAQYTAGLRTSIRSFYTLLGSEYPGVLIVQTSIPPGVQSSTDRFSSKAGMTVTGASDDPNGALWLFNDELATLGNTIGASDLIEIWKGASYDLTANRKYWKAGAERFSTTVATEYVSGNSIVLTDSPQIGDHIVADPSGTHAISTVLSISGTGPYTCLINGPMNPSGTLTVGTIVAASDTSDGTHPSPWAHLVLLAPMVIAWKQARGYV